MTVLLEDSTIKWEQRVNKDYNSKDPKDCLIWCLDKIPAQFETVNILLDTSITDQFNLRRVRMAIRTAKVDESEKLPAICKKDLTDEFYLAVSEELFRLGYLNENQVNNDWNDKKNSAMIVYQYDRFLPKGGFDFETVRSLNIQVE